MAYSDAIPPEILLKMKDNKRREEKEWMNMKPGPASWIIDPEDVTPIWFLDIDGVINAMSWSVPSNYLEGSASPDMPNTFSVAPVEEWDDDTKDKYANSRYQIRWSPEIIERMVALHESGEVRIVWMTTWGEGANIELNKLVGLPDLEVIANPPSSGWTFHSDWWKWFWVREYVATSPATKFIWTDDDLAIERDAVTWAARYDDSQIYTIAPNQYTGLTTNHLASIEKFLRS